MAVAVVLLAPAGSDASNQEPVTLVRELALMGTRAQVKVRAAARAEAIAATEAAIQALEETEARLSTWTEESELAALNRAPVGVPVMVSRRLKAELERALACSEATSEAFDPTLGALAATWDLRGSGRRPAAEELAVARDASGRELLQSIGMGFVRLHPHVQIDAGAWGKGAALDAALEAIAAAHGVHSARLDLGGQIAVWGEGEWEISLAAPDDRARPVLSLTLRSGSVSTSGNSERGLVVDGERIGHILDPRTGRPAPDIGSVTVVAPSGLRADCLSTGLYVLGAERALEFAAATPEVEVLILQSSPAGLVARASSGLAGRLRSLVGRLEIQIDVRSAPPEESTVKNSSLLKRRQRKRDAGAGQAAITPRAAIPNHSPAR